MPKMNRNLRNFEREFLSLAGTWIKCRWQAMGNRGMNEDGTVAFLESRDYAELQFAILGDTDYAAEMRLICAEVMRGRSS